MSDRATVDLFAEDRAHEEFLAPLVKADRNRRGDRSSLSRAIGGRGTPAREAGIRVVPAPLGTRHLHGNPGRVGRGHRHQLLNLRPDPGRNRRGDARSTSGLARYCLSQSAYRAMVHGRSQVVPPGGRPPAGTRHGEVRARLLQGPPKGCGPARRASADAWRYRVRLCPRRRHEPVPSRTGGPVAEVVRG